MFNPDGSLTQIVASAAIGERLLKSMIQSAIQRLMAAQANDPDSSTLELINKINFILVQRRPEDVTSYAWLADLRVGTQDLSVARALRFGHLGDAPTPLVGGYDR
jgi:hypothetical protein